ncbi:MAG: hypothetical protein AVDCRST_MAG10-1411, partial [uncultured Acidimicrobiales bacterium]
ARAWAQHASSGRHRKPPGRAPGVAAAGGGGRGDRCGAAGPGGVSGAGPAGRRDRPHQRGWRPGPPGRHGRPGCRPGARRSASPGHAARTLASLHRDDQL